MYRQVRMSVELLALIAMLLVGVNLGGCKSAEEPVDVAAATDPAEPEAQSSTAATYPSDEAGSLAGTHWRLVEFQSMDDAIGTVRPEDPSLYTMRLNADGTVNMRLNCNRATGTWSAEPNSDGSSGRFEFGPLAMTRALCPPPSLDEQIAAQSEFISSYLLRDGRLFLSLMADGGIYGWEPHSEAAEVPFETEPDEELEEAILQASPDYTREIIGVDGQSGRYLYGRVDLNDDGKEEVFVYLLGSIFCGTGGCNLLLFKDDGEKGYSLINDFPISRLPVVVSAERTAGWHNLVRLESGGGAPSSYLTHVFDGTRYVEHERVATETVPEGTRYLAGEFMFEDGAPLEPRD